MLFHLIDTGSSFTLTGEKIDKDRTLRRDVIRLGTTDGGSFVTLVTLVTADDIEPYSNHITI